MKIAEALGQIQSSQPKMKLRDALMQVNPAYARAKKAEEARIVAEKTKAEAQKYEENARFWETIAHPSGALKSVGTEIVGTTKAVGADLVNVLTPWNQNKISDVQFGGKTFQTPSAKGAEAGTLARQGKYKKAAGKLGEAALDIISTVTPASITIKALKAGSILRAFLGGGLATAPIGAGYGATGAMQEGAGTGDILKQSAKGAGIAFVGGGVLGSIPGITKALPKIIPKIEEVIGKLTTKEVKVLETELKIGKTPEQAIDTVLQSRPLESVKKTDAQVKETVSEPKTEVKPTPEDPLLQEARKYKSAEEFVKAQGTPVYHGGTEIKEVGNMRSKWGAFYMTDNPTYAKSYGGNKSFLNEMVITPEAKLADLRKPSSDIVKQIEDIISPKKTGKTFKIQKPDGSFIEVPETKGGISNPVHSSADIIQGIKDGKAYYAEMPEVKEALKKLGYDGQITSEVPYAKNIGVWNKEVIKTKSQLTDIWNKANQATAEQSLIQEARKYKSAEDFVKAQNKTATGAKVPDTLKIYSLEDKDLGQIYRQSGIKSSAYPTDFIAKNDIPELKIQKGDKVSILANDKDAKRFTIENIPERKTESGTYSKSAQIGDLVEGYSRQDQIDFINKNFSKESLTKSQLTDIWKKAQEKPIDTSLPEQPKPDVTPKKESGYAKSLETKAVEKKMASEFQDLAEYTPAVRKEQAQMTTKLINEDIEKVNSILEGKSELPSGMRGSSLALAVEQHAIANNDVRLLQKLAKSKISTGISEAGSELSMLAGRNANSPVRIIRNIIKARKENVVKRLKGKKISEARKVTKESIKKSIKKEAPTKEAWTNFIKEIKC